MWTHFKKELKEMKVTESFPNTQIILGSCQCGRTGTEWVEDVLGGGRAPEQASGREKRSVRALPSCLADSSVPSAMLSEDHITILRAHNH